MILNRKEHNVAVLQLKTFLPIQLHSNSPFLPICLPKSCGKTCRTWGGQTEEDISGRDAFSKKFQDGSIQNLFIINNTACKEKLNSWVSRKAKRFILYCRWLGNPSKKKKCGKLHIGSDPPPPFDRNCGKFSKNKKNKKSLKNLTKPKIRQFPCKI